MKTIFQRELSPAENRLRMINLVVPHNVIFIGNFDGELDKDLLMAAIKNMQAKCPILSAYIDNDPITCMPMFYSLPDLKQTPLVVEFDFNVERNWERRAAKILKERFGRKMLPLFKVFQVNYVGGFYLFVVFQHIVCDGLSGISLFQMLLNEISHKQSNIINRRWDKCFFGPPLHELLPDLPDGVDIQREDNLFDNTRGSVYRKFYLHIPVAKRSTGFINLTLSPDLLTNIREKCVKNQVSLHSFLSACLCQVLRNNMFHFAYNEKESVRIGCSTLIDVRAYLNPPLSRDVLGFYSSCIFTGYDLIETDNIWKLAKVIQEDLRAEKKSLGFLKRIKRYITLMYKCTTPEYLVESVRVDEPTFGISNVGEIKIDFTSNYACLKEFNVAGTSHVHSRNQDTFFMTISTFMNKISMNLHYVKPVVSYGRAKMMIDKIHNMLVENVQ